MSNYYKTQNEKKQLQEACDVEKEYGFKIVRGRRRYLPSSWDCYRWNDDKCWKKHRKKQYRIKEDKEKRDSSKYAEHRKRIVFYPREDKWSSRRYLNPFYGADRMIESDHNLLVDANRAEIANLVFLKGIWYEYYEDIGWSKLSIPLSSSDRNYFTKKTKSYL